MNADYNLHAQVSLYRSMWTVMLTTAMEMTWLWNEAPVHIHFKGMPHRQ